MEYRIGLNCAIKDEVVYLNSQIEIKRKKKLKLFIFLFFAAGVLRCTVYIHFIFQAGTNIFANYIEYPRETALYVLSSIPQGITLWAIGSALNPNKKFWVKLFKFYGILGTIACVIAFMYFAVII